MPTKTSAAVPRTAPMAMPAIAPFDNPVFDDATLILEGVAVAEVKYTVTGAAVAVAEGAEVIEID